MNNKPRGRPRAFDAEAVLEQSMQMFWTTGFDGTSLDDLVAATGVARPSLAAAFGDKEAIYLKALERFQARMTRVFHESFSESAPLGPALARYYTDSLELYLSGGREPRGCFAFCTATAAATRPAVRQALARALRSLDAALEAVFRRARERGELSPSTDPEEMALLASTALQSLAIRARAGEPRERLRALAIRLANALCPIEGPRR
jgi:TetR/AcrR family transcriptional regulator, copper-responsive repressor